MDIKTFKDLRVDYGDIPLSESSVFSDPFEQFKVWFKDVKSLNLREPNAMALSTVGEDSEPSLRMVLLKEISKRGFIFYTNYESRKGRDIAKNPKVALLFYWADIERQVRIEGEVEKVGSENSDTYFSSRPGEAQVSAVISKQSERIQSREELEILYKEATKDLSSPLKRPENWGGYEVIASRFEFWQGRKGRLHDRIEYLVDNSGEWSIARLAP